eukprot:m.309294 g.309294  ORF g.309294 m.309294 type:complete len:78 (+) comp15945_c5_seq1:320-553(+)
MWSLDEQRALGFEHNAVQELCSHHRWIVSCLFWHFLTVCMSCRRPNKPFGCISGLLQSWHVNGNSTEQSLMCKTAHW